MKNFNAIYEERQEYHVFAYKNDLDFKKYIDAALQFFDNKKGDSILAVGTGEGLEAELLLDKGYDVALVEVSSIALNLFRQRTKNKSWAAKVDTYNDDFTTYHAGQYDWILMLNTLHWIEDETKAVEKIKQVAIKGAYLTVPDAQRSEYDLRSYTKEKLLELFPTSNVYLQDQVRWVVEWEKI